MNTDPTLPDDDIDGAIAQDADRDAGLDASLDDATPTSREQRWRMVLGSDADSGCGALEGDLMGMDAALSALYEPEGSHGLKRRGGRGGSAPNVARWLGDIRKYFPQSVVQVMQRDALERLDMRQMLLEKEMLEGIQPDVHMVANLIALSSVIPAGTRETARLVVRKVVDELMAKLEEPMRSAVSGALDRSRRTRRPRHAEIDWNRTIRANLRHWQESHRTIIPQQLIGFGRKSRQPQREVVLCIDQSGSMAASVVYSSIFGAVLASLPAVATKLVVFDTAVVDMSDKLDDPVELLFGVQLGGGTDIHRAVSYSQQLIREPRNAILVLISDLYEGGVETKLLARAQELVAAGVQFITLLALSDEGRPAYDKDLAAKLAALGVPSFACTPDAFPGLMAAAIRRDDINQWAAGQGLATTRAN
ncbi:VWA domain-containing protein [Montanilutibacter psychrotolerans]|uniref:VWA domain-containing protein n=1 Tax=Montanilutibacter psychrotolerans TaxID=1327343 RepID=A0A3M8SUT5_9GAMM|nr:VWA domain-containing protein [Lysobacter psychrotolerans]RNF82620.1 VWA domain-containing protein [Lysobacter psychrotolerans]